MEALFVDVGAAIPAMAWEVNKAREAVRVYCPELQALRGLNVSGVYVILDLSGRVLYVGESHTGRLHGTITRHFRQWSPSRKAQYANGRASGGVAYDRERCAVAWRICEPELCAALQWAEIVRLRPLDNTVEAMPSEVRESVSVEYPIDDPTGIPF